MKFPYIKNYYLNNSDDLRKQKSFCENELNNILEKLPEKDKFQKYFAGFVNLYSNFLSTTPLIWENVNSLPSERMKHYDSLADFSETLSENILKRLVVIKLNGGLGTTMGCSYPKSLITVRDGMNFLDISMLQLNTLNKKFNSSIPLVLMNSFSTHSETLRTLHKYSNCETKIYTFMQSQYPRISGDTLLPICTSETIKDNTCWYPPGHGNFYEAFYESGLMKKFIDQGRDIAFISNIDNLGATVDLKILQMMSQDTNNNSEIQFVMEVTNKTKADVKVNLFSCFFV
uniref:UTP--glucose-1-phosphate uridylyltransferase n=1 Tax=Henneguya salminicola TaxID=69463 RepID=A0A6G3MEG5_HENSL